MKNATRLRILGFDRRVAIQTAGSAWTQEKRQSCLLKPDSLLPLSVDSTYWPSTREIENWRPGNLADSMNDIALWDGEPIAIAVVEDPSWSQTDLDQWEKITPPHFSMDEMHSWEHLGWDVADSELNSGLILCDAHSRKKQSNVFLNDHHLFVELEHALPFRDERNAQYQNSAPYFVYGIYLLPT